MFFIKKAKLLNIITMIQLQETLKYQKKLDLELNMKEVL